jgi:hypothetical protein
LRQQYLDVADVYFNLGAAKDKQVEFDGASGEQK